MVLHVLHEDQIITLLEIASTNCKMELLEHLQDTYQYLFFDSVPRWSRNEHGLIKIRVRILNGYKGRRLVCATAAMHGHLDLLQLARYQYDMPWDDATCVRMPHCLDIFCLLEFAFHHKCPRREETRKNAEAFHGTNKEVITTWLDKRGCRIKPKRYSDHDDRHEEYYNFMFLSELGYYWHECLNMITQSK